MHRFSPYTLAALVAFAPFAAKADTMDTPNSSLSSFFDTSSPAGPDRCTIADECYADTPTASAAFADDPYSFTLVNPAGVVAYLPGNSGPVFPGFTNNTADPALDLKVGTPEPTSLLLMATGALTTAGRLRRTPKAHAAPPDPPSRV